MQTVVKINYVAGWSRGRYVSRSGGALEIWLGVTDIFGKIGSEFWARLGKVR